MSDRSRIAIVHECRQEGCEFNGTIARSECITPGHETVGVDYVRREETQVELATLREDYRCLQRVNVDLLESDDKQRAEVERLKEELRIARFDADVPVRELREENERLREQHREFLENLTRRLQDLGVPASPSWDKAFDYLAARLVDAAKNDGEGSAGGAVASSPSILEQDLRDAPHLRGLL